MNEAIQIPAAEPKDAEDVISALETANVFNIRGRHSDAIHWIRRAAQCALESGQEGRALTLKHTAAALAAQVAGTTCSSRSGSISLPALPTLPPPPPPPRSVAAHRSSIPPRVRELTSNGRSVSTASLAQAPYYEEEAAARHYEEEVPTRRANPIPSSERPQPASAPADSERSAARRIAKGVNRHYAFRVALRRVATSDVVFEVVVLPPDQAAAEGEHEALVVLLDKDSEIAARVG